MKEQTFIKRLGMLKELEPSQNQLLRVKNQIFSNMEKDLYLSQQSSLWQHYRYAVLVGCLLIFAIFLELPVTQHLLQTTYFTLRITLASNVYTKAQVSLENAYAQLHIDPTLTTKNLADMATITKQTDTIMSQLYLQGESGKYSATQCKRLYLSYYSYLESLSTLLQQQKNAIQLEPIRATINEYKKNAEKRLHFYKITPV